MVEDVESGESGAGAEAGEAGEVMHPVVLVRAESGWLILTEVGKPL